VSDAASNLTARDVKAILLLLDARIASAAGAQKVPWQGLRSRCMGELKTKPDSLAPRLSAFLTAARTGNLDEVDRLAKQLISGLIAHGDTDGANALRRAAEAKYTRPGRAAPGIGGGAAHLAASDDGSVEWFPPEDLSDEMVLDAETGPRLARLVQELRLGELFVDAGIDAPTRIIFSGPPGVGKTLAARWIAGQLGQRLAVARLDGVVSKWVGETATKVRGVLENAKQGAIVFMDEIDGICTRRDNDDGGGGSMESKRVTSALLQQLDLLPRQYIVIAATNYPERLDPALRRRLQTEVVFRFPDPPARRAMVERWWAKVAFDAEALAVLVDKTDGRSGDFLRTVAMVAARTAVIRSADTGGEQRIAAGDAGVAVDEQVAALALTGAALTK